MLRPPAATVPLVALLVLSLPSISALAAGGSVVLRTDDTADGYYYGLGGSGQDRFITEYGAGTFTAGTIICGVRWREHNHGTIPPPGQGIGELRLEDPGNPGCPDIAGGLIATADAASLGTCNGTTNRLFTFGSGAGVPVGDSSLYACVIEPLHGTGGTDFCGTLLDTSSPSQGAAKYYSGGVCGAIPWNHFVEVVVADKRLAVAARATGSARYPGDRGAPVVFTTRPNASGIPSDDSITLTIAIDNGTGASLTRNFSICADRSVIQPSKGWTDVTPHFARIGQAGSIQSPLTLPPGRTVFRLEARSPVLKTKLAAIVNRGPINLPLRVLADDPSVDVDACALEGTIDVDRDARTIGLRRRAGSADDGGMEAFVTVQAPGQAGDAIVARFRAIDLPSVAFTVTGFEVVGGEFGGTGLPGLDAIELRNEDLVFIGNPDLTAIGLLRSFGAADGTGEAPLGPPPTTAVFDVTDFAIDPATSARNLCVCALMLPGGFTSATAIGVDGSPADTQLGDSVAVSSGVLPAFSLFGNAALRLLLDGDRTTLGDSPPSRRQEAPSAPLRVGGRFIAIDRTGRILD